VAEMSWSSDSLERGRKASVAVGSECWGRAVAPSQQARGSVWGSQGAGVVSGPLGVVVVDRALSEHCREEVGYRVPAGSWSQGMAAAVRRCAIFVKVLYCCPACLV
jgi:hypothetical protein